MSVQLERLRSSAAQGVWRPGLVLGDMPWLTGCLLHIAAPRGGDSACCRELPETAMRLGGGWQKA